MKRIFLGLAVLGLTLWQFSLATAASCESLISLKLPDTMITSAESVAAGSLATDAGAHPSQFKDVPEFCRIAATLKPSKDSDIKIEIWLPASNWNGKFEAVGNGGWNGNIVSDALAAGVLRGYAVASTNTGHEGGAGPWMEHPEKLVDFGYRAAHEMTVKAKSIIHAYYGSDAKVSYWSGCSAGGRQGLKAAQKYPEDFDGIVAGAPAINATGRAAFSIWIAQNLHKEESSYIPQNKYGMIHDAVLQACDALDGVKDHVVENPRQCKFDPKVLQCTGADSASCLTSSQVQSARTMYAPLRNPRTQKEIFPGLEYGSEMGWSTFGGLQPFDVGAGLYRDMVFKDPNWDYKTLNFDSDMDLTAKIEKGDINALDPNLQRFFLHGGKIIHYHGWADPQIPSGSSVEYYQSVLDTMGGTNKVKENYRLFMVPGMGHCAGGDGPASFNMLTALEQWVEKGKTPDYIPAVHLTNGHADRTRILCPYPQVATYNRTGDTNDAANFTCK